MTKVTRLSIKSTKGRQKNKSPDLFNQEPHPQKSHLHKEKERRKEQRKKLRSILFYGTSKGERIQRTPPPDNTPPDGLHYLDKLAQLRKGQENQGSQSIVKTDSKQKTDREFFTRKQRSKAISFAASGKLAAIDSPLKKQYINCMYCNSQIEKQGNKVTSKYCKTRICANCNRIRTAKLINTYVPIFKGWEELSFITLTIPNVPGEELREAILRMERAFKKIVDVLRKRGTPLKAVRKTEGTYRIKRNDYHPHYHIICEGLRGDVIALWKHYLPEINYAAQDIKLATEGSAKELFKYFSKVIFNGKFLPYVLDTIFQAVHKKRVFQSYGFKLSDEQKEAEQIEKLESQELTMKYYQDKSDGLYTWINVERTWINSDGEILHPYKPEKNTESLISEINGAKFTGDLPGASPGDLPAG